MTLLVSQNSAPARNANFDYERFAVNLPGRVFMAGHHLHISDASCTIRDISCGGARLTVLPEKMIPTHFFLQINGIRDEIGCTMISRTLEAVSLKFNMLLNEDFLQAILKRATQFERGTGQTSEAHSRDQR